MSRLIKGYKARIISWQLCECKFRMIASSLNFKIYSIAEYVCMIQIVTLKGRR